MTASMASRTECEKDSGKTCKQGTCPIWDETTKSADKLSLSVVVYTKQPDGLAVDHEENSSIDSHDDEPSTSNRAVEVQIHAPEPNDTHNNVIDACPEAVAKAIERAVDQEKRKRGSRQDVNESYCFGDDERESSFPWGRDRIVIHATKSGAIQELCENLRRYPQHGLTRPDRELLNKLEDFHRARYQRRRMFRSSPRGIMGFFLYVRDLKIDLQWTEDTAWRRLNDETPISWQTFNKFHSPERKRVYFVILIELVSITMMTIAMWMNDWKFAPMQENPMIGPPAEILMDLGALSSEAVVDDNEWYRLVAPFVLHAGTIHIVINMLALHFIGGEVERTLGTTLTAVIFLVSGFGGNVLSALFVQGTVSVGASGGMFGLFGICLANIVANWDIITLRNYRDEQDPAYESFQYLRVPLFLAAEMLVNVIIGLTPYIDNFAHLGGLLYGILLGFPLLLLDLTGFSFRTLHSKCHTFFTSRAFSFLTGTLLLAITTTALANYDGSAPLCRSCRYVSCVPFPFWTEEPWWYCDDCYTVSGTWIERPESTTVTLSCPYGEQISDEFAGSMTENQVAKEMQELCRRSCSL